MDIKYNNSAGRLLAILKRAASKAVNDKHDAREVWAEVFNESIEDKGKRIHQENYAELLRRLARTSHHAEG